MKVFSYIIVLFSISFILLPEIVLCDNVTGYHIVKGTPQTALYDWEFKFKNTPDNMPFITIFPLNELKNDTEIEKVEIVDFSGWNIYEFNLKISDNRTEKIWLRFWVHTSISDAEVALVETFCKSSLGRENAIDIDREGEIGDNCWYAFGHAIDFIRNNVRICVSTENWASRQPETVSYFAKKVDTLLIKAEKVDNVSLIQSPIIESVENLSGEIRVNKSFVLKVNAYDPNGQDLKYRFSGQPLAVSWENGILKPFFEQSGLNTLKIWVINEYFIVSSKEMTF